jgi:hypothetical protein
MVASINLQILLRLRPYPIKGHRLLCDNLLNLLFVTWLVWCSGEGHIVGISAEVRRQRNFDRRNRSPCCPDSTPKQTCSDLFTLLLVTWLVWCFR